MSSLKSTPKSLTSKLLAPIIILGYILSATFSRIFVELPIMVAIAISSAMIIAIYLVDRKLHKRNFKNNSFMVKAQRPEGAKGLIILLSPFNSFAKELKKEIAQQLIESIINSPLEKLNKEVFEQLNLENSNLRPALEAVAYHADKGKLRDIWLFTTPDETFKNKAGKPIKRQGSFEAGKLLEAYLKFHYAEKLHTHVEGFCIPSRDYEGLFIKAEEVFNSSGFKDEVMLADITGGNKIMTLALSMACTPPDRKMQYMDSVRDWQGEPLPDGAMRPVLIDVHPMLAS